MDKDAFFWKMYEGKLPPPRAAQTLGIRIISVDGETGVVEMECEGRVEFSNPAGKIQGGFLAAMLDDAMGPALASTLASGEFAPTLNLNVQYLSSAVPGKLSARGMVVRRGAEVCFLSGELRQGGRLVATATATAIIRKL